MTTTNYLIDSYAIIELVKGTKAGKIVKNIMGDGSARISISVLSIYEVGIVLDRNYGRSLKGEVIRSLVTSYETIDVSPEIAQRAIVLKRSFRLPSVDCLIYATAKQMNAQVVSGCKHFKGICDEPDVKII